MPKPSALDIKLMGKKDADHYAKLAPDDAPEFGPYGCAECGAGDHPFSECPVLGADPHPTEQQPSIYAREHKGDFQNLPLWLDVPRVNLEGRSRRWLGPFKNLRNGRMVEIRSASCGAGCYCAAEWREAPR